MKRLIKFFFFITTLVIISLLSHINTKEMAPPSHRLLQNYITTSTRTANVNELCPANVDRSSLVDYNDIESAKEQRNEINSFLGIDGNQLIKKAANGNLNQAMAMVEQIAFKIAIFIGAFLASFVVSLFLWPFLCCCCTCPSCCCPLKCCQKAEEDPYSKCQLQWPVIALTVALCLSLSVSMFGLSKVRVSAPGIRALACSTAIIVDDLLHGNVTSDGSSFFTGLITLTNEIDNLDSNLSNINAQLSDLQGTNTSSDNALTDVSNVLVNVQQVPSTTAPYQLLLNYNSPIDDSLPVLTTESSFKAVLGHYLNSSSLVGEIYTLVQSVKTFISDARVKSIAFSLTYPTVNPALMLIKDSISSITSSIQDLDKNLVSFLGQILTIEDIIMVIIEVCYGLLIAFSFLSLLGVFLIVCCERYGCRYLTYVSCVFITFPTIFGLLVATVLSLLLPVMTWGCTFLDVTMATAQGFKSNINVALDPCMPFGNGRIVDSIASGASMTALNSLTDIISLLGQFNNTQKQNELSGNLTIFINTVNTWCKGQVLDIDASNVAILQNIANSLSGSWSNCNPVFLTDSWVPSNNQNLSYSTIPCQVNNGNSGDATTCTANLANNGGNICGGCMDSSSLETIITTGNINTELNGRYGTTCTFNTPLSNIWTNYYNIKRTVLGGPNGATTPGTVLKRATDAKLAIESTASGGVFAALNTMNTIFTNFNTSLSSINRLIDARTGLIAGLNCHLFGEDLQRIPNILCGSMFNNFYILRYALGTSCYGALFAMCCTVCTGYRYKRHSQHKQRVGNLFFSKAHDDDSENRINTNPKNEMQAFN